MLYTLERDTQYVTLITGTVSYDTGGIQKKKIFDMPEVGFEPTPTNRIELKSTALDHSAIQACVSDTHVVS